MAIGPDALSVCRRKEQIARARAGRDDDILRGQFLGLAILGNRECVRRKQLSITHMNGDLVLFHQMRDALVQLLGNATRPLHNGVNIRAYTRSSQAVIAGMLHIVIDLRRPQQCLGRNASPVEANPAKIFTFDNRDFQPKLRCANCGNISTRARAEDDQIIISHSTPPGPKASLLVP